ncbi:MAG: DUF255 domain-containing protein [bacterium]|nr:DUF255 domain-containing protein [bacterium]
MNELVNSNSPYLLSHKDNPINWRIWNNSSIQQARIENKPIFLSIGYFTCHWCHVMAREVFEDEEVARILNENFVCIKVDREENPDIDSFYMKALSILQDGRAGWPANLFLTPDLKPFLGFTYLPRSNFIKIVSMIARMWQEDQNELKEYAEKIYDYLTKDYLSYFTGIDPKILDMNNLEKFLYDIDKGIYSSLDRKGGFNFRPKFPPHQILEYMLLRMEDTPSKYILESLDRTLTNMILGGMYDVIDGGFCRYSVDENWMVPHFEKMLYDNSFLIYIYSKAAEIYKNVDLNKSKVFKEISVKVFEFLKNFLSNGKVFFSALSAESRDKDRDEEGAYYLFNPSEIKEITRVFHDFYDFFDTYDFYNPFTKYKGLIVHYRDFPDYHKWDRIEEISSTIRKIRNTKNKPYLDNKVILSWNCILATYLFKSYEASGNIEFLYSAANIIDFILRKMMDFQNLELYRIMVNGNVYGKAVLEDYVWLGLALYYYWKINKKEDYLELSRKLFRKIVDLFYRNGNFYNSTDTPSFDIFDSSIHSNTSIAIILSFLLNLDIADELKGLILKIFNFSENFLYIGSFLSFLVIYKQRLQNVRCRLEKFGKEYIISFISEFDVKPPSVSVNENTSLSINLQVCDQEKCFEIRKNIDL